MKKPDFAPNDKVVVVDEGNENYGKAGVVVDVVPCRADLSCAAPGEADGWKVCVQIGDYLYAWFFPAAEGALAPAP